MKSSASLAFRSARTAIRRGAPSRNIYYGVNFPVTKAKIPLLQSTADDRSTSETDKHILAAAVAAVDIDLGHKIDAEKNWRYKYTNHLVDSLKLSAYNEENAMKISQAGIDYMYNGFDFFKMDGEVIKFNDALENMKGTFHTGTVKGEKAKPSRQEIEIPYKCFHTGEYRKLKGQELIDQVSKWVDYGTIEADSGEAIKEVVKNPQWLDLQGKHFVLLGATSAMGPFQLLKELGAHIIAVDLDKPAIWKRLIEEVKYNSHGSITFPMNTPFTGQTGHDLYAACGANIVARTPEVRNWLMTAVPEVCKGEPVNMGAYTYLDGELHVRVNLACDAILNGVIQSYGPEKCTLHFLPTPTDAYVIPEAAAAAINTNHANAPTWQKVIETVAGSTMGKMVPNKTIPVKREDGSTVHIMDGLMTTQGPNYAMAKRLQQWRCVLARKQGAKVAFSIAPATATASVLSNKLFAAAYGGAHYWKPVEIFYQEFSSAVCATLLLHDVHNPKSPANPANQVEGGSMMFLSQKAFHGGFMRVPYMFTSIGEVAATIYFWNLFKAALGKFMKKPQGKAAGASVALLFAYVSYQLTLAGA
mmetsp:Transcript_12361/g.29610  ORF Transcript_12361/g.29610 Transcript_12361/m.29610 type:complete len:586 (-) Transcript_12361:69-1826(-)|eukprot:692001-Rhodomonas_salina.1